MAKKKHTKEALMADKCSGWIATGRLPQDRLAKLRLYATRFVIECEAVGTTRQTSGFIKDLRINTTQRVRAISKKLSLNESIFYEAKSSPEDLAELLREDNVADDDFIGSELGFVYITFSGMKPVVEQVKCLREFRESATRKTGSAKQNKSEFYRLDSFFRHLRNAIAHGQYAYTERDDGAVFWAFQDVNAKGKVTSRMLVPESLLDSWVHELCARDKRYQD